MEKPSLVEALGQARMFLQAEIESRMKRVLVIRVSTGRAARVIEKKGKRCSAARLEAVKRVLTLLFDEELRLREEEKCISMALLALADPTDPDNIFLPLALLGRFRAAAAGVMSRTGDYRIFSRFFPDKNARAEHLRVICRALADAAVDRGQGF
ncbi:hypothetical protein A3F28_03235 [Candidatus Uhrbacteria bacterium RIFCSPHIGHO2_12_FULL_57_11]|uniref:Uncharacterized protein n=1 Tax=Candidatus Uhrbacteria bacterium RIFCSPHIGHO2_12_FULL_57_11 TaxID=1802398 RepID=A0A1F7UIA9_9BACT|nr:MAG: hypothetical protein A3F28_03235 [Candidatus Uhrbacteria bacterium RIFCSPHIGHO2_12_FULL_57_11]